MNWEKRVKLSVISVLVLLVIFVLIPGTEASFWVKGDGFYYSPDYGTLKDGLVKAAPGYDVWQQLSPGTASAFSAGYDFSNHWGVRLDMFKFTGVADYHRFTNPSILFFETSTSPTLLSIVYRVLTQSKLHSYLGAGIGIFPSELKIESNMYEGAHYTDSPLGFQVLIGTEYRFKEFFFSGELRYLSAKAEYPEYRCIEDSSTDWSGVFISLGVGYRFRKSEAK